MPGGRSVRQRTPPTLAQEVLAQGKVVGTVGVAVAVALHQAGHRPSPPATSVDAVARWGIGHASLARSPRTSKHTSCKMKRRPRLCLRRQP
jgi:hypothetical protein